MGKMKFKKERKRGVVSILYYYCDTCEKTITISSHPASNNLNQALVWGATSIGIGYSQTDELFSVMNIPSVRSKFYRKLETEIGDIWEKKLQLEMADAAKVENKLAIERGDIEHGVPFITVIVDGGWAKRSYGHGFSSLSGVGCIIGEKTKKSLYLVIKNKFCLICAIGASKNVIPNTHKLSAAVRKSITKVVSTKQLCEDLKNIPYHVFGNHSNCRTEYCTRKKNNEEIYIPLLQTSGLFDEIIKVIENVIRKANRITRNVTTNYAERYMSLVSKFSGGKRVNYVLRGSYQRRSNEDLSQDEIKIKKDEILSRLRNDDVETLAIETIGQHDNAKWHEVRRNRITASSFGRICNRRETTSCHSFLKNLLYSSPYLATDAILYGRTHEKIALEKYEEIMKVQVKSSGFFISKEYPYLGASPDGLINEDGLVEVKCLYSIRNEKIKESLEKKQKNMCVKLEDEKLHLKKITNIFTKFRVS
ncbi:hypothetical protein RN001_005312 [Aquatica leii]|uniref:YqaJ viral recombinase domain-containing protein n=1 Tax=Aquatica leii TaxID=1421715 RepID=A0AAN7PCK1_9COLE|nr:hypothetical protein RN001_005312 [Aquatica leii]